MDKDMLILVMTACLQILYEEGNCSQVHRVKHLRSLTGLGLKWAKELSDRLDALEPDRRKEAVKGVVLLLVAQMQ